MKNKKELREQNKLIRKQNNLHIHDSRIVHNLMTSKTYKLSKNIMLFYPLSDEINLLETINDPNKTFSFPSLITDEIVPYINNGCFQKGAFGINEPQNSLPQDLSTLDLVIAPALAVDLNGYRVGYGKGYYDRFIKKLDRTKTKIAVVIYEDFLVDEIDIDKFDEKSDIIITEKRIILL